MTDQEIKEYIKSKGWSTLWHEDNWIHRGIMQVANLDYCGLDLKGAYDCQKKHEQNNKLTNS